VKDLITKYQNEQNTRCEGYEAASGNIEERVTDSRKLEP